jgi:hypothetical protein
VTEVIYLVRNNSQQFLGIELPPNGKMLAEVSVRGELQQPSRRPNQNEILIRLPVQQGTDQTFVVRFIYEVPSAHPGSSLWPRGTIRVDPPKLSDGTQVMQTEWSFYLPSGYRYVKFGGPMQEALSPPTSWTWFQHRFAPVVPHLGPMQYPQRGAGGPSIDQQIANYQNTINSGGVNLQVAGGLGGLLHRMDAPSQVAISYRSLTYYYTVAWIFFLAALYFGIKLTPASREAKFAYVFFVGIGALIVAGVVDPRGTDKWEGIYIGVFLSLLYWLCRGLFLKSGGVFSKLYHWFEREIKRLKEHKPAAQPPPAVPPQATPEPPSI